MNLIYTQDIKIEQVYEGEVLKKIQEYYIPNYHCEFRPPKRDETFVTLAGEELKSALQMSQYDAPRLVLLGKKDPVFEIYGKTLEEIKSNLDNQWELVSETPREVKGGEYFIATKNFTVNQYKSDLDISIVRLVVRPMKQQTPQPQEDWIQVIF